MILAPFRWLVHLSVIGGTILTVTSGSARAQTSDGGPLRRRATHPEVTRLTFTGVKSVDEDELRKSLAIEASRCRSLLLKPVCWISHSPIFYQHAYLDHDELARDVVRGLVFYYLRGYRATTIDTTVTRSGRAQVHVTIAVHEGEPTRVAGIDLTQTAPVLNANDVETRLVLKTGEPLNLFKLDSTRVRLRDRLWEKGYADAIVDTSTTIDTTVHRATVAIAIDPRWIARVKEIAVSGNAQVSTRTIKKSLLFAPGDIFRRSTVLESQRLLYESNLFRRAQIQVPRRQDSLKTVTVTVQEAPPHTIRTSLGFNTIDFVQVQAGFTDYNWFGGARRLNVQLTVGNLFASSLNGNGIFYDVSKTVVGASAPQYFRPTYTAAADVRQPWFGSPKNDIALGVFSHRRSAPGIYVDRGYGASATFTRMLTQRGPASLNYRFEITNVEASDVYFCVSNGVCDAPTLNALRKEQRLSPLTLTSSLDKTNDPYEPRRGYRARLDAEHASQITASDFRYNKVSSELAMFLPIGQRAALGGHLLGGYVNALASTSAAVGVAPTGTSGTRDLLHPRKRFYLGGATSVRGFAENQLGPRVLTISPVTLRGPTTTTSGSSTTTTPSCPASTPIAQCNPNASYIKDKDFDPRPLGGNAVIEANAEFRFPVWGDILGAVFVDGGYLAQNSNTALPKSRTAITPGIGGRYLSPVGPIRVDLGLNPRVRESLPVVTEDVVNGQPTLVTLGTRRLYAPTGGFLSRLTLHLAIGEAF